MPERIELPTAWAAALAALGQGPDLAWEPSELAALAPDRSAAERLFSAALHARLAEAMGHTRLDLGADAPPWLGAFGPTLDPVALLADPALAGLVAEPGGLAPLIAGEGWIATGRSALQERTLAAFFRGKLGEAPPLPVEASTLETPFRLNDEQRAAVRLAASSRLALITGGPGTGKTSIVSALLQAASGLRVEVAAPTGKAAQRLGEALQGLAAPRTLHRLLGWQPGSGKWRRHGADPLEADLVVVDEASMVDQDLMLRLLDALRPEARLVLVGDADQLPSVGSGAVLRDLAAALPGAVARLERSYRMDASDPGGGAILAYARRVRDGVAEEADLPLRARADATEGQGVELLPRAELGAWLAAWRRRIEALPGYGALVHREYRAGMEGFEPEDAEALRRLMDHHDRFRLLALLQEGPEGAEGLNAALHRLAWPLNGRGLQREQPFYLGEPVMMRRNDYGRGLYNGDAGLVVKVRRGAELRREAVFFGEQGPRAFPAAALGAELALNYALTVHKAQGSEFDAIAVVQPAGDHPLLTRQNLYTALTRARKHALLIGDAALPPLAARREERRVTGLEGLLRS